MTQRRISLDGVLTCEIVHWESTHEKTPEGIRCMVTTGCGYIGSVLSIRDTRSDAPPTCLHCAARSKAAWLG